MPELAWYSWACIVIVVLLVFWMAYELYIAPTIDDFDEYERQLEADFEELDKQRKQDDERSGI